MEWVLWCVIGALGILVLCLVLRLWEIRRSLRALPEALEEKLRTDTNTLLSVSTGDREVRRLAAALNVQLGALNQERRRLQSGDMELKTAVTNISHDLRTPLTAISGYLELLAREPLPEQAGRYFAVIRERVEALKNLTEELFRYSVITSTAEELNLQEVQVNRILEDALADFYGAFTNKGIVPEIRLPKDPVVRTLDPTALRRVLENILNNAWKYSDGDLEITLETDGTLIFQNHAADLDPVQVERLFDRFYTVSSVRNSTGLGLYIARLLAEKMGGSISAAYQNGALRILLKFP